MTRIIAVLAMDESCLIGSNQGLPWNIPEDMKHFKELTLWGVVVMGRNTYESLPVNVRPLPGRRNIVITRSQLEWVETCGSIEEFLRFLEISEIEKVFVIWGAQIYNEFFRRNLVDEVELTLVRGVHTGDVYVDDFRPKFMLQKSEIFEGGEFQVLQRK